MIYLELLWSFMQIGLFSIGGGYAAMPLIQNQVVDLHPWLTIQQFADIMTIAEMTPGPIAINAATFVGIQVAGLPGALVATFGCVLPPFCIVLVLAWVYFKPPQLQKISSKTMIHHQLLPLKQPQIPLLLHILFTSKNFVELCCPHSML